MILLKENSSRDRVYFLHKTLEFFLNGPKFSLNSANSGNLINHLSTISAKFKDAASVMCPCLSDKRQQVLMTNFNDKYFFSLNSEKRFRKTPLSQKTMNYLFEGTIVFRDFPK